MTGEGLVEGGTQEPVEGNVGAGVVGAGVIGEVLVEGGTQAPVEGVVGAGAIGRLGAGIVLAGGKYWVEPLFHWMTDAPVPTTSRGASPPPKPAGRMS